MDRTALFAALRTQLPEAGDAELESIAGELEAGKAAALAARKPIVDAMFYWLASLPADDERRVRQVGAVLAAEGGARAAGAIKWILEKAADPAAAKAVLKKLAPKGSEVAKLLGNRAIKDRR